VSGPFEGDLSVLVNERVSSRRHYELAVRDDNAEVVIDLRGDAGSIAADDVAADADRFVPICHDAIYAAVIRRAADVVISLILLVLLAPVGLAVAACIALDTRGPVLFRQPRVGRGGVAFEFVKFRTMHVNARERFPHLYDYQFDRRELATMYFKLSDDPRLTRFGRWLRRTSLDEIPNLLNVLQGQMTLVGPRPDLVEMLPNYTQAQLVKFSVKPGLTGLAQVSGRNILRFQETVAADLYYVEHRSLRLDLKILKRTVRVVAQQVGAL